MSTAFRQSRSVLLTSLINKTGSIGLSLLPMLLVEGRYSSAQSSLVMSVVKGSMIVAVLLAGWLGDVASLRATVLGAFLCAALGLAALPLPGGLWVLMVSGVVAQMGITSINSSLRLLLTRSVERKNQKEALGWMRTVNNLGQVASYALATLTATLGARVLIWFDALTSFLAFLAGRKLLPQAPARAAGAPGAPRVPGDGSWWALAGCTVLMFSWNFLYDFYMVGVAARLKLDQPETGLRLFSLVMVLNTVLCAALGVVASRWINRAIPTLVLASSLTALGVGAAILGFASVPWLVAGAFLITFGEVLYGVFAQFLLIRSVPPARRENTIYSGALLLSNLARVLASAVAFPRLVYTHDFRPAVLIVAAATLSTWLVLAVGARRFAQLAEG